MLDCQCNVRTVQHRDTESKRMIWRLITQRPSASFEELDMWYNEHLLGKRIRIRYMFTDYPSTHRHILVVRIFWPLFLLL